MVAALAALFLFLVPTEAFACVRASGTQKPIKDKYWDAVAICETNSNWKNGGNWAGGLGIYLQTWHGYGGGQFASTPAKATRKEQIIVANRISVHGWQTKKVFMTTEDRLNNKPLFRYPVGFFGWGCIKNRKSLHPSKWGRKKEASCQKSSSLDPKVP